ncbi:MAG: arginine--tRNA ligase, partial [Oscillospiraceae bacterium]|nr:arginine--tRNA ligase [Oscillospiraceae bacterium]
QVFRCARKAELVREDCELEFLGFGTMNGSDGHAYKTRDGGVMRLSDLLDSAGKAAAEKLSSSDFTESDRQSETAERVGVAAIKFGDLINHRSKDYIFDLDKFLSFEGKTGTYLLYSLTRINSILKKVGAGASAPFSAAEVYTDSERDLMLALLLSGESFKHGFEEKAPNYICESAYTIATAFSRFYHDNHIVNEANEAKKFAWIGLCALTKRVLEKHLEVLAIEPVESM